GARRDAGPTIFAAEAGSGRTDVVVYPWDVSLAREAPDDSALNHVRDEIVSLTPLGNRARVRLKLLTAEVTTASIERLALRPGDRVVASFKARQARLLSGTEGGRETGSSGAMRSASASATPRPISGDFFRRLSNAGSVITSTSTSLVAVTVAVRGIFVTSAISPKKSPSFIVLILAPPFVTSASPFSRTKNSRPRSPSLAISLPALRSISSAM